MSHRKRRHSLPELFGNLAKILSPVPILVLLWQQSHGEYPVLTELVSLTIVLYAIRQVPLPTHPESAVLRARLRQMLRLWLPIVVSSGLLLFQVGRAQQVARQWEKMRTFTKLLAGCTWVAYEPIGMDPHSGKESPEIKIEDVRKQLRTLHEHGFDGLLTLTSDGICGKVPGIAKDVGFKGVIAGITDMGDGDKARAELEGALAAEASVDGYCVGHRFWAKGCPPEEVLKCMRRLAKSTGKPVSTTLTPYGYEQYPKLAKQADWFCPDIHVEWYAEANVDAVLTGTKLAIRDMIEVRRTHYPTRPILLKMICFPSAGVDHANEDTQAGFYKLLQEYLANSSPEDVYASYFSAFDIQWKTGDTWSPGERHVGLFRQDLSPKKAVRIFEEVARERDALADDGM